MSLQNPQNSIAGWFFTDEQIASAQTDGMMLNPSIDLSNPCNLNCPYCYIEEKGSLRKLRKANELSLEETLRVISDFYNCGARTINIVGSGEPTIDPHFREIVQNISTLGITSVIFTNGIRLANEPELVDFLYVNNSSVVLKFNSRDSTTQDLIAGRKKYSEKRDKALELLIDRGFASHSPTRLGVDVMVFKGNLEEIPEIHIWCRKNNIFPIAGEFIPSGRTQNGIFQGHETLLEFSEDEQDRISKILQPIDSFQRKELLLELLKIDKTYGIERNNHYAYVGGGICTQIIGLYVDIEGNIYPCVAKSKINEDGYSNGLLGNIRKGDSPCEIWHGNSYMTKIRSSFTGGCPYKPVLLSKT